MCTTMLSNKTEKGSLLPYLNKEKRGDTWYTCLFQQCREYNTQIDECKLYLVKRWLTHIMAGNGWFTSSLYVCLYVYVCTYVCMYVCKYFCMYIGVHVYICLLCKCI